MNQGSRCTAVGTYSGFNHQSLESTAVGVAAGEIYQGRNAVAVGNRSGWYYQGDYSVAIGNKAGETNLPAETIILNASPYAFNPLTNGFYVNPIRRINNPPNWKYLQYNTSTGEIYVNP